MPIQLTADFFGTTTSVVSILALGPKYTGKADDAVVAVAKRVTESAKGIVRFDEGALQDSIGWVKTGEGEARIGTGSPYGARIELDFTGPDSTGRTFDHTTLPAAWLSPWIPLVNGWMIEELRK